MLRNEYQQYRRLPLLVRFICEMAILGTLVSVARITIWPFDLFQHFNTYYLILFTIACLAALWYRLRIALLLSISLLTANAFFLFPVFKAELLRNSEAGIFLSQGFHPPPMNLVSLNLLSFPLAPQRTSDWLKSSNADFIMLSEYSPKWERPLEALKNSYPYQVLFPQLGNFGLALFSKWPLEKAAIAPLTGEVGVGTLSAIALTPQGKVRLVGVHLTPPLTPKLTRWRNLSIQAIQEMLLTAGLPTIVAGDFNAAPWSYPLRNIVLDEKISSIMFSLNTWPAPLAPYVGLPLDHAFTGGELILLKIEQGPFVGSDHLPLTIKFYIPFK